MKTFSAPLCLCVSVLCFLLLSFPLHAQNAQCGVVQSIRFPVDTTVFRIAQDFGAPSTRHQGRYHTGEDWFGGRDTSLGQPVRAIAGGRVTYASPDGWGRDGGVVILEHTFPDGTIAYSEYGHMMETEATPFPAPFTCVREGDVVGAVGDARPAPHVHLEIKVNNPDIPGSGYSIENPALGGWLRPTQFILNWQARLQPAYRWHYETVSETASSVAPVELDDYSLIFADSGRVARLSADGRLLWRTIVERPVAGLVRYEDGALIVYADGSTQLINVEGGLSAGWQLDATFDSPLMSAGNLLLFHSSGNRLVALDAGASAVRWALDGVPRVTRWHTAGQLIGLVVEDGELLTVSSGGQLLDRVQLRDGAALASGAGGSLLAYTRGGLWTVQADGTWQVFRDDARAVSSAASLAQQGRLYLFDGDILSAYDSGGALVWQVALPNITGGTSLNVYGAVVLLLGERGQIIALRAADGGLCNMTRIYGDARTRLWHRLGDDGILRIALGDQILGLDWRTFLLACE